MNKKSELITLSLILLLFLLVGFVIIENKLEKREIVVNYVGDFSTKVVYNIRSNNPNCDFSSILIDKKDVRYLDDIQKALENGFVLDTSCD